MAKTPRARRKTGIIRATATSFRVQTLAVAVLDLGIFRWEPCSIDWEFPSGYNFTSNPFAFVRMRRLVNRIETELKEQDICAVYNSELARVWPTTISPEKRKKEIKRFAQKHRLAVTFYDVGLCAVFEKAQRESREQELILPIPLAKRSKRKRRGS